MSYLRKHIVKDKIKWVVTFILIAILALGLIGTIAQVNKDKLTTKTLTGKDFSKYGINTVTGLSYTDTELEEVLNNAKEDGVTYNVFGTLKYHKVKDLEITIDETYFTDHSDTIITFYFYDEFKNPIGTNVGDNGFTATKCELSALKADVNIPEEAKYFRVNINIGAGVKNLNLDVYNNYLKGLEITYNR